MSPDRLRRFANVLLNGLELEPELRKTYLQTLGDPELQREVEQWIRRTEDDPTAIETPVRSEGVEPGQHLGPYRIVERIGAGGMGVVLLAEREDHEFERRVAIKILRAGFDVPEVVKRFVTERQILAQLEHPHIAALYEGGTTSDGRPYLVMEHVRGLPIHQYCDEQALGVEERVRLMVKVCDAVAYAHSRLVVHRDLKPSNLLITEVGEPKLLDFGIAKLLDPEAFPMTVARTVTGQSPMTPHYASPEQIRGGGITTASDVYSLGVILYRLLAGRLPYRLGGAGSREALIEAIEKSPPSRPSHAVLEQSAPSDEEVSRLTGTSRLSLHRSLAGDLDSIVLKALRPEAKYRFSSPSDLARDLERHLNGLPVEARQDTWRYRAGKFIRRHRLGVGLSVATALVLAGLSLFLTWQSAAVTRERNVALSALDQAELATKSEEQVVSFLIELFEAADPARSGGDTVTARELVETGAVQIEALVEEDPALGARLSYALARAHEAIGLPGPAARLLDRTQEVLGELEEPDRVLLARSLRDRAVIFLQQGKLEEAEPLLEASIREARLTDSAFDLAVSLSARGKLSLSSRDIDTCIEYYRQAIEVASASEDKGAREVLVTSHSELGSCLDLARDDEQAEFHFRRALELADGESFDVWAANAYTNLGGFYYYRQRRVEARDAFEEAALIFERIYGPDDYRTASVYVNLAIMELDIGRYLAAIKTSTRALEIAERSLGAESGLGIVARCNLGGQYLFIGDLERAEDLASRCLELANGAAGSNEQWILEGMLYLSEIRAEQGRLASLDRVLKDIKGILDSHDVLAPNYSGRVGQLECKLRIALGEYEEAAEACGAVLLEVQAQENGAGSRAEFSAQLRLLELEILEQDQSAAKQRVGHLNEIAADVSPLPYFRCQFARLRGDLAVALGEAQEAEAHYRSSLEIGRTAGFLDTQYDLSRASRGLQALGGE
ncbi:MAG: tetratricopeptide repeat protein [Acidobacteriota bacterium]